MIFKKKKDNKLNQCNIYLQNALQFITKKQYDVAYIEICYAIMENDGKLTKEQDEKLTRIIVKRMKES